MKAIDIKEGMVINGWKVTWVGIHQGGGCYHFPDPGGFLMTDAILIILEQRVATAAWTEESPRTVANTRRIWFRDDENVIVG